MRLYSEYKDRKRIDKWKQSALLELKNKHEDTNLLIKDKAEANQQELKPKVYILRAFYG